MMVELCMDKKSTVIIAILVILALIGIFTISLQTSKLNTVDQVADVASTTKWLNTPADKPNELQITEKTVISAKHAYQNGQHIIAGEVLMPTPCHVLDTSIIATSDMKQVSVNLLSSIKTGETCAEVITGARFKVSIKADKTAKISATLNGQPVVLNLIEAGANENLDNFDLYIKG